jgi:predicted enzyme related to lactoylglutathione lyase
MRIIGIDITMHVPSLEKTMAWYANVLGWKHGCDLKNESGECLYGDVYYAREPLIGFNLSKSKDKLDPSSFHPLIKVPDVEELYAEIREKDVEIIQKPQEQAWGKTLKIRDVNGYILEFWNELDASFRAGGAP